MWSFCRTQILLQTNARHKQVGHRSIFIHSEDSSLSVLSFLMRQLCMDEVPQQDAGKFQTSFDMPSESGHCQVDCKRPGLTFVGAFERYV